MTHDFASRQCFTQSLAHAWQVTLPTSAALATAVEQLLNGSLGGKLAVALRSASRGGSCQTGRWPRLTALLRIYACALRMHAECSGMQPQIAPLPGQGIGDAIASAGGEIGGDEAADEGGFFACLGSDSQLPDLGALVEAVTGALLSHCANQHRVGKGKEPPVCCEAILQALTPMHTTNIPYLCYPSMLPQMQALLLPATTFAKSWKSCAWEASFMHAQLGSPTVKMSNCTATHNILVHLQAFRMNRVSWRLPGWHLRSALCSG